jgi:hypothetical protein
MQIVQIKQDDNNGFVCVVPAEVRVIPVDDIDEANKVLHKLVKGQLEKLDVEFEPIADGKHRSIYSNIEAVTDNEDHYFICTATDVNSCVPVADIFIEETPIQITWFLVDYEVKMKELKLTIYITKEGEYRATEYCTVSVAADVAQNDFDTLFDALRDQHSYLYGEYPDSTFEITDVEAV